MKRVIIFVVVFLSLFSIYSLFKADYSTDILSMLPLEDEVIKEQYKVLSAFGSMEKVVFEISTIGNNVDWKVLSEDARIVLKELQKDSVFIFNSDITPEAFFEIRNSLIKNWPSLISPEDSIYISTRLSNDSLYQMLDRTLSSLFTFSASSADPYLLKNDPFGFHPILLKRLAAFSPSKDIRVRDGLLTNSKSDKVLLIAEYNSKQEDGKVLESIKSVENLISKKSNLIWMGAVRASLDNSKSIRRDINVTLPITITMIFLICFLIYKNRSFGFITFIPTIISILITFGLFAYFTNFSLIIVGFAAALMGITVDFAIHYLYHVDTVHTDPNPLKTVKAPILASAFTTAGAFLVLSTSNIPALSQLGLITAFGIVSASFLSIFLLPLFVKKSINIRKAHIEPSEFFKKVYESTLYKSSIIVLIVFSLIMWIFIPKLKFDGDPDNMNGMSKETIAVESSLNNNWSGIGEGAYLTVSSKNIDTLLMDCENKLVPLINKYNKQGKFSVGGSFTEILPSKRNQNQNIIRWKSVFNDSVMLKMRVVISEVSLKYNLPPEPFFEYVNGLNINDESKEFVSFKSYPSFLENGLLKNSLIKKDSLWIGAIPIIAENNNSWKIIDNEARAEGIVAVNDDVLGFRIVALIKAAFLKSALLIPLVIMIIIVIMLKNVKGIVQVFIPTCLAAGLTLGLMSIFNIKVNIVTMMVFAFIFGLGIDYSLLMFFMSKKEIEEGHDYTSHGAASVSVAALTTLSGLGVLVLAKHPVIKTLGITGMLGILSSYFCAVILVPYFVKRIK